RSVLIGALGAAPAGSVGDHEAVDTAHEPQLQLRAAALPDGRHGAGRPAAAQVLQPGNLLRNRPGRDAFQLDQLAVAIHAVLVETATLHAEEIDSIRPAAGKLDQRAGALVLAALLIGVGGGLRDLDPGPAPEQLQPGAPLLAVLVRAVDRDEVVR